MEKSKVRKNSKGITLVALVVTIVVLLILAGITIMYVMGENSVFKQAEDAKLKTEIAKYQEMLETAKSPVIIEGLGKFNPDRYFEYIEGQGIIEDREIDVIDNNNGTYDVTTKPGYIFEVELVPSQENPRDAEITYVGKEGEGIPKIRGIKVTGKTKTSIDIKVTARLGGGEIKCYYKKASEVLEGEGATDITGYTEVTLDENLIGHMTGLTASEKYKIKAIIRKDGKDVDSKAIEETTNLLVSSVTVKPATVQMEEGKTINLTVEVIPENAEEKGVTWSSSNTAVATVDENGVVTGKTAGTATITATAKDGSGKSGSSSVTVEEAESNWAEIAEIAKAIAGNSSITSSSTQATVTVNGESKTIKVGDIYKVKYKEIKLKPVRVLGFKHDNLVNTGVYGGYHSRAGISFEFMDGLEEYNMNGTNASNSTNANGWADTKIRRAFNGYTTNEASQSGAIGGFGASLGNKDYIKQVKKKYIPTYNQTSTSTCNDYLWLLAASEIWNNGSQTNGYGGAITTEGPQYQYYRGINPIYSKNNVNLIKKVNGWPDYWWLRSPHYSNDKIFCLVDTYGGNTGSGDSFNDHGVMPGFSI